MELGLACSVCSHLNPLRAATCDRCNAAIAPRMAMGTGAELFADLVWGYFITTTVRVGFAQGLRGKDAATQVYGMLGTPF